MFDVMYALSETAADFEDDLFPIAIGLVVAAMIYAAIAAWMVTPAEDPTHH
jgi:hypothetical protein